MLFSLISFNQRLAEIPFSKSKNALSDLVIEFLLLDVLEKCVVLHVLDNGSWVFAEYIRKQSVLGRGECRSGGDSFVRVLIQLVWLENVQLFFLQFSILSAAIPPSSSPHLFSVEMSLNLRLVDHSHGRAFFDDLSFVDLLFHRSLCNESVDVDRLLLAESVDAEEGLSIVTEAGTFLSFQFNCRIVNYYLGFQQASKMTTRFAATMFVPREPALVEMSMSRVRTLSLSLNLVWTLSRLLDMTEPSMTM